MRVIVLGMPQTSEFQRGAIFVCFMNDMSITATRTFMTVAFGPDTPSYDCIKWWFKEFQAGRHDLKRKKGSGRPPAAAVPQHKAFLDNAIGDNPFQSVRELSVVSNIPRESVRRHLHSLNLTKRSTRFIPKHLTAEMKAQRLQCAQRGLQLLASGDVNIRNMVTIDEKMFSLFTKFGRQRSKAWQRIGAPRIAVPKSMGRTQATAQLYAVAISCEGIEHVFRVPLKTTVTAQVYKSQVLEGALRSFKAKRRNQRIWLLHDNARPHIAGTVKAYLAECNVSVIDHPPYSPDLSPCDYFLFSLMTKKMAGQKHDDLDQLEQRLHGHFQTIPRARFFRGMQEWRKRLQLVVAAEGDYFDENLLRTA